ncbi:MAG: Stp1/IreP family PP2C-type Ser/Thr phosphatase [Rhodocyclaceae bacterium]|nr:Stp1/IreP family PP2C-type Ser/Thr phosphatase [Rhodocyclaceae bacterium]
MSLDLSSALSFAHQSDAGMVRNHNEDAVYVIPRLGVALLADGMGGYNAGEVASGMATALIGSELERMLDNGPLNPFGPNPAEAAQKVLIQEIGRANAAIYQAAHSQPQYSGMGTTLVAALFFDNAVTVAHVGDSRLYRFRDAQLAQLTRDHSLLQEQIDSGMISVEDAKLSHNKNLVTRAVGVDPEVEPEIHAYPTQAGDVYLLCSDGLNDMVDDAEIALTLQTLSANLELAAAQLVQMANDNGGRDNVSVILVRVLQAFPAPRGWLQRFLAWLK